MNLKRIGLFLLAALFITAGITHLLRPHPFMQIMPPKIPKPDWMVAFSGLAEILGGVGILVPLSRQLAGRCLAVLLVCVFPANVYMALEHLSPAGMHISPLLLWARLPLQPLLIWWVLAVSHAKSSVTDSKQYV